MSEEDRERIKITERHKRLGTNQNSLYELKSFKKNLFSMKKGKYG